MPFLVPYFKRLAAAIRILSAFSLIKPSASFWLYAPPSSSNVAILCLYKKYAVNWHPSNTARFYRVSFRQECRVFLHNPAMIGVRYEPQQATNTEILVITSKRVGGNVGVRLRLTPTYAVRGTLDVYRKVLAR